MEQRVKRIEKLGADVRVLPVNYDETVNEALDETRRTAESNRPVQFIQDTTLDNYFVRIWAFKILFKPAKWSFLN